MADSAGTNLQVPTFLVVGGLSALIDIGLLQLLLTQAVPIVAATSIAFLAGLVFNLVCHARFTFRTTISRYTVARYACLVGLNYGITLGCVSLAFMVADSPMIGKIIALVIVPVISFLGGKHWVFK